MIRNYFRISAFSLLLGFAPAVFADDDAETKAIDSTATQWSFQTAYQVNSYHDDMVNGEPRREGLTDFVQLRIVAPIPLKNFTILPRLTIRHYEAANGESGLGNTELFGLFMPNGWD